MKRYLGSKITAFSAVIAPCFVGVSIIFALIALSTEVSIATLFITLLCIACTIIWCIYIRSVSNQLYCWGYFDDSSIQVKRCMGEKYILEYTKCRAVGICMYTHGILNSRFGTDIFFIFFSYGPFDEKYRFNLNLWRPSRTRVKVEFDWKLYNYLLDVLPERQARSLQHDCEKYIHSKHT